MYDSGAYEIAATFRAKVVTRELIHEYIRNSDSTQMNRKAAVSNKQLTNHSGLDWWAYTWWWKMA